MYIVAANSRRTIKKNIWLNLRIVTCCCSMLDERMVDEYNQLYEWYGLAVVLWLHIDVDSRGRDAQILFLLVERDTNCFWS